MKLACHEKHTGTHFAAVKALVTSISILLDVEKNQMNFD